MLSDIYMYAWSLGLKTTYYLRTLGASRVEKSTVNMAKFGGTSKSEAPAAGGTPSSVILQESVTVITQDALISQGSSTIISESVVSPVTMSEIAAAIEQKQIEAGQSTLDYASIKQPAHQVVQSPLYENRGIPTFGAATSIADIPAASRPKVEIIGETCESCSA